MVIRDAEPNDLPALLAIYNYSVRSSAATFDLQEQTLQQRQAWFAKYNENYPLLVAEEAGAIVGYACFGKYRDKPAYQQTVESSVYVDHRHQGKGIGKQLMQRLIERAKQLQYHVMIAGITKGNESSVVLHERLGFQYVGVFREVGFKFGQYQDVEFYQLFL
ncbi:GNAT family N-acetyltransferase [Brevibacillus fulvus]|uniref:GNAT family N-acetyltransferase n=1 Tax=Brevibacillus fulvus TaxID=1125967 RepID=UPI00195D2D1A